MNTQVRSVAVMLLMIIASTILITFAKNSLHSSAEEELNYALRVATQDATVSMMDKNHLFGYDESGQTFDVNISAAAEQFERSFIENVASGRVNEVDVAFSGIADQWYIYGQYANGHQTLPYGYVFCKSSDKWNLGDKTDQSIQYEFSLGYSFRETDLTTGTVTTKSLKDLPENYFSSIASNKIFHDATVMSSINGFLTECYTSTDNLTAINAGTGLEFNLGLFDYTEDNSTLLNNLPAVIDGPGYFAIADYYDSFINQRVRIFSIGSAELINKIAKKGAISLEMAPSLKL